MQIKVSFTFPLYSSVVSAFDFKTISDFLILDALSHRLYSFRTERLITLLATNIDELLLAQRLWSCLSSPLLF